MGDELTVLTINFRRVKGMCCVTILPPTGRTQQNPADPFVRLCLFHSLNRQFQNHARLCRAVEGAVLPLNI